MLKQLYDKVIALSASHARAAGAGGGVLRRELVFPGPARPHARAHGAGAAATSARLYALVCTIASVLGGLLGYAIGALLYDTLGHWLISAYGYGEGVEAFRAAYAKWGAWIILIKGMTPIPYKIVTIASGFAGYNLFSFFVLSHHHAGLALLPRGGAVAHLWRADPRLHREPPHPRHHRLRGGGDRRLPHRPICVLRWRCRSTRSQDG